VYKLAALDAAFLYNETDRSPQHVASVQVIELPEGSNETQFIADLKKLALSRIHLIPYFTNKLQFVPFNLDHPVWVRDDKFDIDRHILRAEVDAPGGRREMEARIAELHAQTMDRSKPLWELWVLTGLEGGRVAFYNRSHHSALDGVSGQAAVAAFMDLTPEPQSVEPAPEGFFRGAGPKAAGALMTNAFENFMKFQVRQASKAFSHLDTAVRLFQRTIDPSKGLGAVTEGAPRTRFNQSVQTKRSYATGELPLGEVKAIGKLTGTTVNDVFLAVCGGALRRYLKRLGELPEQSMVAGCPVSLRKPGDTALNNQVSMMMVACATDEPDPVKRLLKTARSSAQAKGVIADMSGSYDTDVSLPGLPALMTSVLQLAESANIADLTGTRLPCNVIVSNVPGPRETLYALGGRMLTHYPVSIPAHTQAVNITVQSYTDQMYFAITGCAAALPDADALRDDMLAEFMELKRRLLETAPAQLDVRKRAIAAKQVPASRRPAEASAPAGRRKVGDDQVASGGRDSSRAA
jgi:WS/DGAT/MGAT family acyltransferase